MDIELKNKKVLVMGLGLHGGGVGVTKWLGRQGAKVTVTDLKTRTQLKNSLSELKGLKVKYVLGKHRVADFSQADLVIKNPAVPNNSKYLKIAKKNKIPTESDISLFFLQSPAPVIGITGTKGKTTVTTLIGEIFKQAKKNPVVAGNIRISPLKFLNRIKKNSQVILELSSWQLESLVKHSISPHIAVVTNIFPDHLNRYFSFASYIKSKSLILKFQTLGDVAILNRDNKEARRLGKLVSSQRFWFSQKYFSEENGSYLKNGWLWYRQAGKERRILKIEDIRLIGKHNLDNVLAAVTVAMISRLPVAKIRLAVKKFTGVPHRLELIRQAGGVKYYNDTAATAPEAAIQALQTLGSRTRNIILLAGGADKELKFKDLAKVIQTRVRAVVLFKGTATPKLKKELLKLNYWAITEVSSMKQAIKYANKLANKGDIVLLSPGCASFGIFENEFDRGDQFKQEVRMTPSL